MRRVGSVLMVSGLLLVGLAVVAFLVSAPAAAQAAFPDPNDPAAVWKFITQDSPYTEWGTWPQDQFTGYLQSGTPHTKVVRIFVNDVGLSVATSFPGEMPANTIIVKQNFMGETLDSPGKLGVVTIMYKVPGFNKDGGDWFWAKYKPDGTADAAGKVASCATCHYGITGNKDGILRWGFGGEPAVATAAGSEAVAQVLQKMQQPQQLPKTGRGSVNSNMIGIVLAAVGGLMVLLVGYGLRQRAAR